MSSKTRIRGACKLCLCANLYYGNRTGDPTGVWCAGRNGRIKHQPKMIKDCKWFKSKFREEDGVMEAKA